MNHEAIPDTHRKYDDRFVIRTNVPFSSLTVGGIVLIIAMPKSASTSLLKTLGKLHNLPASQIFFSEYFVPAELSILYRYHSDMRDLDKDIVRKFSMPNSFYKQHIPPSEHNIEMLKGIKKVILLRNPESVIEAYYRAEYAKLHSPRAEFSGYDTLDAWKDRSREIGLMEDLKWFKDSWLEEAIRNPDNNLIVNYEILVKDVDLVIQSIERFLKLPLSKDVVLLKKRYTRKHFLIIGLQSVMLHLISLIKRSDHLREMLRFIKKALQW